MASGRSTTCATAHGFVWGLYGADDAGGGGWRPGSISGCAKCACCVRTVARRRSSDAGVRPMAEGEQGGEQRLRTGESQAADRPLEGIAAEEEFLAAGDRKSVVQG